MRVSERARAKEYMCGFKPGAVIQRPEMTGLIKATVRAGYAEVGIVKGITQPYSSY